MLILILFLNLNPTPKRPFKSYVNEFDFLGLFLLVSGVVAFLIGFHFSEASWSSPKTISLLVVGVVLFGFAAANERLIKNRQPIIPPRLFTSRTPGCLLAGVIIHGIMFFAISYYLPNYFQVLGASATNAGLRMIPYSLGGALFAITSGQVVARIGRYRGIMWLSWFLLVPGVVCPIP
jgi:uncharacterized membrane protein YiaA